MNLPEQFLSFGKKNDLFTPEDDIVVAVSGGIDSMVAANLFLKTKQKFAIAHCNFDLREKDSDDDELFVENFARNNSIRFFKKKFNTKEFADENKLSVQEAARNLRYFWFKQLASENNFSKIATAHHLDDSIETFFINMLRGSGIQGLSGIPVKNENIVRPLIFLKKSEIENYASENKISFRNDKSNDEDHYLRNRIRHHIIPEFKKLVPDFEGSMQNVFSNLFFTRIIQKKYISGFKEKNIYTDDENNVHIPSESITKYINQIPLLNEVFYSYGIKGAETEKILNAKTGSIFYCDKGRIVRTQNEIILQFDFQQPEKKELLLEKSEKVKIGRQNIQTSIIDTEKIDLSGENSHFLDADLLSFPLKVRNWKNGDYFFPLGMKHKKKISDYMIDRKFSLIEKENCMVVLSGQDIVCILGHRIDERYKVPGNAKNCFRIEFNIND